MLFGNLDVYITGCFLFFYNRKIYDVEKRTAKRARKLKEGNINGKRELGFKPVEITHLLSRSVAWDSVQSCLCPEAQAREPNMGDGGGVLSPRNAIKTYFFFYFSPGHIFSLGAREGGRKRGRSGWVGTGRARGHRSEVMGHVVEGVGYGVLEGRRFTSLLFFLKDNVAGAMSMGG